MSPMNRVAPRAAAFDSLLFILRKVFAAPLITYPLGVSTGANRAADVPPAALSSG